MELDKKNNAQNILKFKKKNKRGINIPLSVFFLFLGSFCFNAGVVFADYEYNLNNEISTTSPMAYTFPYNFLWQIDINAFITSIDFFNEIDIFIEPDLFGSFPRNVNLQIFCDSELRASLETTLTNSTQKFYTFATSSIFEMQDIETEVCDLRVYSSSAEKVGGSDFDSIENSCVSTNGLNCGGGIDDMAIKFRFNESNLNRILYISEPKMLETYATSSNIYPSFAYIVESETHYIKYVLKNTITDYTYFLNGLYGELQNGTGSGGVSLSETLNINFGSGVYDFKIVIVDSDNNFLTESSLITFRIGEDYDFTEYYNSVNASSTFCERYDNIIIKWLCGLFFDVFIPSNDSFLMFNDLKNEIENKPPFGYFALFGDLFTGMGTTTPPFVLTSIPAVKEHIATPIKTGLSWIFYLFTALWGIYYISEKIHT